MHLCCAEVSQRWLDKSRRDVSVWVGVVLWPGNETGFLWATAAVHPSSGLCQHSGRHSYWFEPDSSSLLLWQWSIKVHLDIINRPDASWVPALQPHNGNTTPLWSTYHCCYNEDIKQQEFLSVWHFFKVFIVHKWNVYGTLTSHKLPPEACIREQRYRLMLLPLCLKGAA